ncbi:MAG: NYN domain-containing protein [Acidobacteria bacterium]|nr:NYN domain-containing protein [Acidobacteriota bacterium]
MKKKTAVLIDLGFAVNKLHRSLGRYVAAPDLHHLALKCLDSEREELFRIYCYHCPPGSFKLQHPISGNEVDMTARKTYAHNLRLIEDLKQTNNVAFRSGEVAFQGWRLSHDAVRQISRSGRPLTADDIIPDIKQKGVDMKIGLDVAWLASKGIVERIILITGDSDFIAPMKFARREGVQIILATLGHKYVKKELREHTDEQREVAFP